MGAWKVQSLEGRLHLGLTLSLALLIGASWWLGHDTLHRSTEAYVLSRLQHDAEALLGTLRDAPDVLGDTAGEGMMPIYRQPLSGHYFKVLIGDRVLRSRSLWDQDIALDPLAPGAVSHWRARGPNGRELLVRAAGYGVGGETATVAVAEDLSPLHAVLRRFERAVAAIALGGLALMVLVQRTIVRRTFRRLRPVYRDIEALEQGAKSRLTERVPREIEPLVRKLNGLLSVYGKRLERSRGAAGNLAHAIKGPLNLMVQQLERGTGALDGEGRRICREQVERVRVLLDRELKRARIAGGARPGSLFDPAAELPPLTDLLLRMHPDKGLDLECAIEPGLTLAADREDMLELIGTLLDNACKWAEHRVRCAIGRGRAEGASGVTLSIEDDGPGCDEADLGAIAARGARLDESVAGHGLGLSIAREVVGSYGGQLILGRSAALGGFRAEVWLPAPPMAAGPHPGDGRAAGVR